MIYGERLTPAEPEKLERDAKEVKFRRRPYTIYAVDFDGVLCENAWPDIGDPLPYNIRFIKGVRDLGNRVILWTCRTGELLADAVEWCRRLGLEFDEVNENIPEVIEQYGGDARKIFADYYIDDKAVLMSGLTDAIENYNAHPFGWKRKEDLPKQIYIDEIRAEARGRTGPVWCRSEWAEREKGEQRETTDL